MNKVFFTPFEISNPSKTVVGILRNSQVNRYILSVSIIWLLFVFSVLIRKSIKEMLLNWSEHSSVWGWRGHRRFLFLVSQQTSALLQMGHISALLCLLRRVRRYPFYGSHFRAKQDNWNGFDISEAQSEAFYLHTTSWQSFLTTIKKKKTKKIRYNTHVVFAINK